MNNMLKLAFYTIGAASLVVITKTAMNNVTIVPEGQTTYIIKTA